MSAPDQSTAYGRLWWSLWDNYTHAEKKAIIDAFAHELAERIREASVTQDTNWDAITWTRGMGHAADLIDPEVSK